MANLKRGIILMNLGSPDSTEVHEVRKYLNEFLTDKRVIDSWFVRNILVRTVIVPKQGAEVSQSLSHYLDKKRITVDTIYPGTGRKITGSSVGTRKYCHAIWKSRIWSQLMNPC